MGLELATQMALAALFVFFDVLCLRTTKKGHLNIAATQDQTIGIWPLGIRNPSLYGDSGSRIFVTVKERLSGNVGNS